MEENRIKELADKFLEFIPRKQFFYLDELKKIIGKKVKELRKNKISETEYLQAMAYLLNQRILSCRLDRVPGAEFRVVNGYIIISDKVVGEVCRPSQS